MNVFVDTSVWSLALRRDKPSCRPEVATLGECLAGGDTVFTTGLVLQELLQGIQGPRHRRLILEGFAALPFLTPSREDHIEAADLRNRCRRRGVQIGTIDALLARLCVANGLVMLTTDQDFLHVARILPLRLLPIQPG